nr:carboxymuconolactone decarboxylase family protein [Kordiimonas gwangyangensis]
MSQTAPVNIYSHAKDIVAALTAAEEIIHTSGFDYKLHYLLRLRASQMNGCAFCVKMHTAEARKVGETNERLDRLIVWRHVSDFTAREKAAFAYVEALTECGGRTDYGAQRANLRSHFSDAEIATMTTIVAMINMWNRIQVSQH